MLLININQFIFTCVFFYSFILALAFFLHCFYSRTRSNQRPAVMWPGCSVFCMLCSGVKFRKCRESEYFWKSLLRMRCDGWWRRAWSRWKCFDLICWINISVIRYQCDWSPLNAVCFIAVSASFSQIWRFIWWKVSSWVSVTFDSTCELHSAPPAAGVTVQPEFGSSLMFDSELVGRFKPTGSSTEKSLESTFSF